MATVRETIDIQAPVEQVFATITDPRRTGEWNPNIVSVSRPQPLPVQPGTTWTQAVQVMGRTQQLVCRIVEWDPPRRGTLEISGDQRATVVTVCAVFAGGTRVTQTIDFRPPGGMFGSLAAGFAGPMLQREMRQVMERQKQALERG